MVMSELHGSKSKSQGSAVEVLVDDDGLVDVELIMVISDELISGIVVESGNVEVAMDDVVAIDNVVTIVVMEVISDVIDGVVVEMAQSHDIVIVMLSSIISLFNML
jgi:hypothetical protein